MRYVVKNWAKFQHYKTRKPPWIKLYRGLLEDYEFMSLSVASKALAPMLWLLASESDDGSIEGDSARIAFRVRMGDKEVSASLKELISKGFLSNASNTLAECLQDACLETERETETETEKPPRAKRSGIPKDFGISESVREWANAEGYAPFLQSHLDYFRDYAESNGKTYADWDKAFRNCIRGDWGGVRKNAKARPEPSDWRKDPRFVGVA
jgi:hypothetical protein